MPRDPESSSRPKSGDGRERSDGPEPGAKEPGPKQQGPRKTVNTRRPFTRADAIEAGIAPKLLRGSMFRRIFRGVYVDATTPASAKQRAEAALCFFKKDAFASHASAGRIHEVPLPTLPDEHVSVPKQGQRRQHPGIKVHVAASAEVMVVDGVRVSAYEQMFVELADLVGLVDLVVVGDNLVKRKLTTPEKLVEFCRASEARTGRAAERAAAYVRDKVDSPMETRLRMLIVLAGLPEPEINTILRTEDGEPFRRYDLSYPAVKVIVEYDGRQHIERVESWEADLTRREAIDDGWRILVVISSGIYKNPEQTVLRVWRLLRSRRLPGVPGTPAADWRPHFPGHS